MIRKVLALFLMCLSAPGVAFSWTSTTFAGNRLNHRRCLQKASGATEVFQLNLRSPSVQEDTSVTSTNQSSSVKNCRAFFWGALLVAAATGFGQPLPASAASSPRVVAEIQGSGLVFKDSLRIEGFEDPKVKGVTLYVSNFQRPVTERMNAKTLFSDPSYASLTCVQSSPTVTISDSISKSPQGEEVFEESKSLLFKSLKVQRIYDAPTQNLVYVSYNTRLNKNDDDNKARFKSSLCSVHVTDTPTVAVDEK